MRNNRKSAVSRVEEYLTERKTPGLVTITVPDGKLVNTSPVKVNCIIHGTYITKVVCFANKLNCRYCSQAKVAKNQRKTIEERIVDFRKIHNDKYDYSLAPRYIKSNKVKIKIICPTHGLFEQRVIDHLKGADCRHCTRNSADKAYILCICDAGKPIALKYGITKHPDKRLQAIKKGTNYDVIRLGTWVFDDSEKCISSEREIKDNVLPVLTRDEFNEGFTETCNVSLLDYIIKTMKEFGGVRWN